MRDLKWIRHGVLALCLVPARGVSAEGQSLRVQQPTLVAQATPEHPFDEPHLTVDPRDDNHWLAATIVRGSAPTFPDVLRTNPAHRSSQRTVARRGIATTFQ
jgi:hypothetical protein